MPHKEIFTLLIYFIINNFHIEVLDFKSFTRCFIITLINLFIQETFDIYIYIYIAKGDTYMSKATYHPQWDWEY